MFYFINKIHSIDYQRVTIVNLISQFPSSHFVQSPILRNIQNKPEFLLSLKTMNHEP